MTPWQAYKQKKAAEEESSGVKNKSAETAPASEYRLRYTSESRARLDACLGCEKLVKETKQCSECSCFVTHYVLLKQQSCPIGKW